MNNYVCIYGPWGGRQTLIATGIRFHILYWGASTAKLCLKKGGYIQGETARRYEADSLEIIWEDRQDNLVLFVDKMLFSCIHLYLHRLPQSCSWPLRPPMTFLHRRHHCCRNLPYYFHSLCFGPSLCRNHQSHSWNRTRGEIKTLNHDSPRKWNGMTENGDQGFKRGDVALVAK